MKKIRMIGGALTIALAGCITALGAEETITWMVLDWKPWMIIEGKDAGTGRFNHILRVAQNNLPQYRHITEKMNWARFWHEVRNKKNICYPFGLKSGDREQYVYYSAPHTFVLPNAIILRKETAAMLGNPSAYSLATLLADQRLQGYAEKNRSFTRPVDIVLQEHEPGNLTRVSESAESLVKMVMMRRIDYTLEYPLVAAYHQQKLGDAEVLTSIPITEMEPFSFVYMNCTRNEWGRRVIERWNAVLRELKPTDGFRRITEIGHVDEKELLMIRKYYDLFLAEED